VLLWQCFLSCGVRAVQFRVVPLVINFVGVVLRKHFREQCFCCSAFVAAFLSWGVRAVLFRAVPFSHYFCGSGFEEALLAAVIL
jgi:hypothetical protein